MILINPKQVEWLVYNQPDITFYLPDNEDYVGFNDLSIDDVKRAETSWLFYLTPETYNSLPTEFKQLAD
jgi:hypothetical protein